ncbi:MAG: hypothetical protein H6Q90_662 [Deltaproteobacteria bacterium]|nr:hypothetical protein [Deltaproteobacteria bacterium]
MTPRESELGQLCRGGDWACVHGDLEALGRIAQDLADCASEPAHCELRALVEQCRRDPEGAADAWTRLKHRMLGGYSP